MKDAEIDKWIQAKPAFESACKAMPQLGISGSAGSWIWFGRMVMPILEKKGVAKRVPGRRYLVDSTVFDKAMFDVVINGEYKLPSQRQGVAA